MSKKKSLGSSPIGYQTTGTLGFIPDLGGEREDETYNQPTEGGGYKNKQPSKITTPSKVKKKTVSYYLDQRLIAKVKSIAKDRDLCYSGLVTRILNQWLLEKES